MRNIEIPGWTLVGPGYTDPPVNDLADSAGALIYFDPSHPANPVVGTPAEYPNLVGENAAILAGNGATTANTGLTSANGFTATSGKVERTEKGGLHVAPSKTQDVTGQFFQLSMTSTVSSYILANKNDKWFMSASIRITRAGGPASAEQQILRVGQNTSTYAVSIAEGSAGTSILGQPSPDRTTASTPGLACISVAGSGSALPSVSQIFALGGPTSATFLHRTPSYILYFVYVENLTVSGRTFAQARAAAEDVHNRGHAASGRWANDTYTAPTTLAP